MPQPQTCNPKMCYRRYRNCTVKAIVPHGGNIQPAFNRTLRQHRATREPDSTRQPVLAISDRVVRPEHAPQESIRREGGGGAHEGRMHTGDHPLAMDVHMYTCYDAWPMVVL